MYIYADNAATTSVSKSVVEAMIPYFSEYYGNPSSIHKVGQRAKNAIEESRENIARLLGARPKEIYFTSGGTESDNQAVVSAARLGAKNGKRHIISSKFEHHAVLHTLDELEGQGFEITLIDVNSNGVINPDDVRNAIREDTALVTIMYVNNEIGTIQPIDEIAHICHERGVLFHTDAVQAIGHVPINVKEQNVDMLSLSAHKFHGPKGVGILYASSDINLSNVLFGGAQERGKRAGTENVAGIVGMSVALGEAIKNTEDSNERLAPLQDKLIAGLSQIPRSHLNGDRDRRITSNVNFTFEGVEGESLLILLDEKGIAVSAGSACAAGSIDPSHVLLSIGVPKDIAPGTIRITLSEDASLEQVDYIIKSVTEVVEHLRSFSPAWANLQTNIRVINERNNI